MKILGISCHPLKMAALKFISLATYNLSGKSAKNKKILAELKDKYKGKRCFIVCNGPSLKASDLDVLHKNNELTFASNKIDKIFTQTDWRPTFYTVLDEGYQYSLLEVMNKVPAQYKFFRKESYVVTKKVRGNKVFLKTFKDRNLLENPKFEENAMNGIYTIATVTFGMLQLAVYMGIREIYIIGCDNSYGKEIKKDGTIVDNGTVSYFSGSDSKESKHAAATWEMNVAYEFARKYADKHKIRIFNATRGGHLEAFDRVNFGDLFNLY